MSAYFTEGRHLGSHRRAGRARERCRASMPDAARRALESSQYVDAVRADQAQAAAYGINGVPFFVIDGKYGVSGAQPPEAFAQVARQVWAERREARTPWSPPAPEPPRSAREVAPR